MYGVLDYQGLRQTVKNIFTPNISILAISSFLVITTSGLFKSAMELEDAEQAYYSQWWRLGYDDQPPLYTWLQIAFNKVLGSTVLSFTMLRGLIFALTLWFCHRFAKEYLKQVDKANIAVFLLALVPVFIDFAFRRLSHTTLLCLIVLFTYWAILKLISKKSTYHYLLFGIAVGLGLLTKYNFLLVPLALLLAVPFSKSLQSIVLTPTILISVAIAVIICIPHYLWLYTHSAFLVELQNSIYQKTESLENSNSFFAFLALLKSFSSLVMPLAVFFVLGWVFKVIKFERPNKKDWLFKMLLAQFAILVAAALFFGGQKFETRWLLPLFLPFMVYLVKLLRFTSTAKPSRYLYFFFLLIVFFQLVRTPAEKVFGMKSSVHYSFKPLSEKLKKSYPESQWILPDVTYAGEIRYHAQPKEVYFFNDYTLPKNEIDSSRAIFIFKEGDLPLEKLSLTDSLPAFGEDEINLYFYQQK